MRTRSLGAFMGGQGHSAIVRQPVQLLARVNTSYINPPFDFLHYQKKKMMFDFGTFKYEDVILIFFLNVNTRSTVTPFKYVM